MSVVDRVLVLGGSMAGLLTAAAVARHASEVILVERQDMNGPDWAFRSVAPQGKAPHGLLISGFRAVDRLLPGVGEEFFEAGGVEARDSWLVMGGILRRHPEWPDGRSVFASRALIETCIRRRVRSLPNVRICSPAVVRGLEVSGERVHGVSVDAPGGSRRFEADLVVDALGRATRSPQWLAQAGFDVPTVERVEVGIEYTYLQVERRDGDLRGAGWFFVQNTPENPRFGMAIAMENSRWQVVLGGYFGDVAPADPPGLSAFARSLPNPELESVLAREWVSPPGRYRFPSSQRYRWERMRPLGGFVPVGDSVASFNPIYGQGMSSAALQAELLAELLPSVGPGGELFSRFAAQASRVVDNPWTIATGTDFVYPETRGVRPKGTASINRYMARVLRAGAVDPVVNDVFFRVMHLLEPPAALFRPGIATRVAIHGGLRTEAVAVGATS